MTHAGIFHLKNCKKVCYANTADPGRIERDSPHYSIMPLVDRAKWLHLPHITPKQTACNLQPNLPSALGAGTVDPAWLRAQYGVCALPVCGTRIVVVHGAAAAHMRCKALLD